MTRLLFLCLLATTLHTVAQPIRSGRNTGAAPAGPATFSISFPAQQTQPGGPVSQPLDGRVLLIVARTDKTEPRQQVSDASKQRSCSASMLMV